MQITTGEFTIPPRGYVDLVDRIQNLHEINLQKLPYETLPLEVRMAFQGWKNYFMESEAISEFQPTFEQMNRFLKNYPHYGRSHWRNILKASQPNYLISDLEKIQDSSEQVPKEELSSFFAHCTL